MASDENRSTAPLWRRLNWPLVAALVAVALVRPLSSITGLSDALGRPATPVVLTVAVSLVWILAVGLSRVRHPLATLVVTGLGYALASLVLSAVLSPLLTGQLRGPLVTPLAVLPLFAVNAAWGALCGLCALGLRRLRGVRP
ncbi:hypothetical protein NI17_005125 [Thermobifida halotolerans]|uniref:Uncharacterized protein n=1 Tax=Thermobifida halotolerans TaxID=483545 RepID=A0AA97LYI8_9ACTN|nr:hypothetical protein [Thermobifida halotolerans]UOE20602.1 hypothetical protein NI17_005125 [Thermobifida halotolerans]